jgi:hypothetical protein
MKNCSCLNVNVYLKKNRGQQSICVVGKFEGRMFNNKPGSWAQQKVKP